MARRAKPPFTAITQSSGIAALGCLFIGGRCPATYTCSSFLCNYGGVTPITQTELHAAGRPKHKQDFFFPGLRPYNWPEMKTAEIWPQLIQKLYGVCRFYRIRYGLRGRCILAPVLELSPYSVSWSREIIIRPNTSLQLGGVVHCKGLELSLLFEISLLKMHAIV